MKKQAKSKVEKEFLITQPDPKEVKIQPLENVTVEYDDSVDDETIMSEIEDSIEDSIEIGAKVEVDERFSDKNKKKILFDKEMKKKIEKENKKSVKLGKRKFLFSKLKSAIKITSILRTLDFMFNIFSISFIIISAIITLKYLIIGDHLMVAAGCLLMFMSIYLNEKIS